MEDEKSTPPVAAHTQPSRPAQSGARDPALDLHLVCEEDEVVAVSSAALLRATDSEAIADVIRLLQQSGAGASEPIQWAVAPDQAATWNVVWTLIKEPAALAKDAGLTWVRTAGYAATGRRAQAGGCAPCDHAHSAVRAACTRARLLPKRAQASVDQVVWLADKYALKQAMLKAQAWVCLEALTAPPGRFPHLMNRDAALRVLRLRELLLKCGLSEADAALSHVMQQDVQVPPLATVPHSASPRTHCWQCQRLTWVTLLPTGPRCNRCKSDLRDQPSAVRGQLRTALQQYQEGAHAYEAAYKVLMSVGLLLAQ